MEGQRRRLFCRWGPLTVEAREAAPAAAAGGAGPLPRCLGSLSLGCSAGGPPGPLWPFPAGPATRLSLCLRRAPPPPPASWGTRRAPQAARLSPRLEASVPYPPSARPFLRGAMSATDCSPGSSPRSRR